MVVKLADPNDARTYHVTSDWGGFFVVDQDGMPVEMNPERRYTSYVSAKHAIDGMVADDLAELASRKEEVA